MRKLIGNSLATLAIAAVGVAALVLAAPASAITIIDADTVAFDQDQTGEMFDVTWFCDTGAACGGVNNTTDTALSGSTWWTLDSLSDTVAVFTVKIVNDTLDGVFMSWGVGDITPDVSSAVIVDSDDGGLGGDTTWNASLNVTAPGFGTVDLCIFSANNCSGGALGDGLVEGGMDVVELTLTGDFSGTTTFDVFSGKWQSVGTGGISLEPAGTVDITDGQSVPEPSTLALLGLGLLAGFALRRRH